MSDFDFRQFEQFARNWERSASELDQFYKDFLTEMAMRLLAKVKKRQVFVGAVDTGAMLNAWQIGEVRGVGSNVEIDITNFMEYGTFVEFGHRSVSGAWVEGRFILTISLDEIQREMPARFHRDFKRWLVERGMA